MNQRRAFTIGLGKFADPILETIQSVFAQTALDTKQTGIGKVQPTTPLTQMRLLAQPEEPIGFTATSCVLSLNKTQLGDLYFKPHVRGWSGPNWYNWGRALHANRLLGRLSVYHHATTLRKRLSTEFSRTNSGENTSIYLIAPLHDPFASGAFIDVAYQLHNIALDHNAQLYGILVLPDTTDDPLIKSTTHEINEIETVKHEQLHQAIAYAALRELNFITSPYAFDPTHTSNDSLMAALRQPHLSPFASGDCYIVGGKTREDTKIPLSYSALKQECANFILLHTQTAMGQQLASNRTDRPLFSTFSASISTTNDTSQRVYNIEKNTLYHAQYMVLDHLRRPDTRENTDNFIDIERIPLPNATPDTILSYMDDWEENTTANPHDRLRQEETRYQRDVEIFRKMAKHLSEESAEQQERLEREWNSLLKTRLSEPNMTLFTLSQAVESAQRNLEARYIGYEKASESMERATLNQATRMNTARTQYINLIQSEAHQPVFAIIGLACILTIAAFLWGLGQGFLTLLWLIFSLTLPRIANGWIRHQRETTAEHRLHIARQEFLKQQSQIAQSRALSAHLYEVSQLFKRKVIYTVQRMTEITHDSYQEIERKLGAFSPNTAPDIHIPDISSDVLRQIYDLALSQDKPSAEFFLEKLGEIISNHQFRQTSQAAETTINLSQIIQSAQSHSPMLPLLNSQIAGEDRDNTKTIIGLWGYNDNTQNQHLPNQAAAQTNTSFENVSRDLRGEQGDKKIYVIRQRVNIPLSALHKLPDYQAAYRESSSMIDNNSTYFYRAFLHPTRWGIATPEISRQPPEITETSPRFIPLLVITLRLGTETNPSQTQLITPQESPQSRARNHLKLMCQRLGVTTQPYIDYDSLCGALYESTEMVNQLVLQAKDKQSTQREEADHENILSIACKHAREAFPAVSEKYADWEVVAAKHLLLLDSSSNDYRTLHSITAYFASANNTLFDTQF